MLVSIDGVVIVLRDYVIKLWCKDTSVELSHTRRGDIEVQLVSPDSTVSTLLPYCKYDYINWSFMTIHHWGEDPVGDWQVKVYFKSTSGEVEDRCCGFLCIWNTWRHT